MTQPLRHKFPGGITVRMLCILMLLTAAPGTSARADELMADLSDNLISITSNFSGAQIFAFGAIEVTPESTDPFAFPVGGLDADVVIVLEGPPGKVTVRRKERVAGIWLNGTSVTFKKVPGFVHVASTRPLDEIADFRTLRRHRIGLENVMPQANEAEERKSAPDTGETGGGSAPPEAPPGNPASEEEKAPSKHAVRDQLFRRALIWEKAREGLYSEAPGSVALNSGRLFRARIDIPAQVPVGDYKVTFYLLRDGRVTAAQSAPLFIERSNIEQRIFRFAHRQPLIYGLSAVAVACLSGFLASTAVRRK